MYHLQSLIVEERTEEGDVILRHNVHRQAHHMLRQCTSIAFI